MVALAPAEMVAAADVAVTAGGAKRAETDRGVMETKLPSGDVSARLGVSAERKRQNRSDQKRFNGRASQPHLHAA